jgi:hypothetical protein
LTNVGRAGFPEVSLIAEVNHQIPDLDPKKAVVPGLAFVPFLKRMEKLGTNVIKISFHRVYHQLGDLRSVHDGRKLSLRIVDHDLGADEVTSGAFGANGAANIVALRMKVVEFSRARDNEVKADRCFRIIDHAGIRARSRCGDPSLRSFGRIMATSALPCSASRTCRSF